ncbi:peptide cleavage/export ABC transporter [Lactobacillus pentosus]|jgi:ATP-binding cassette subfamily C protein/competence factor transporting protein|uniref:Peptide cleavage/export ABC transporter n=1 Tax=Lactiplantibacillus pentosus TaxID=1589 RepID=A0AB37RJE7_LACPE|nr:peptide cleavage/export ABC transporter [Lactiplantibacillus pentosus]MCH4129474.1 peptide cleavage/export ABC transporter [Lactiplantibacillus sp.]BBM21335.1 bacteriocin ABC-transporter, ATP-binding and permease protein PlnG [Lactiplantibacillus plantarum]MCT3291637.1 ATP-binding cassette domain-containing protein [Lactiplantibacillus pentosus]MPQ19166.1 peptide cleavage/export ABC transporter [Lactiplantibacillus pentosus]RMW46892.1 peptide cleavage/export ABC transporter [Lactiplantibaci
MRWRNYVAQVDEMDCGVAALAMILKNYGSTTSLAYLRNIAKTSLEGTTALGLVKTAEKLGFETKAIQADMSLFELQDLPLPFIVHVTKNGDLQHFYVVVKASKTHVVIADPDPTVAVINMPRERFEKEWSGVALFFAPKSEYKPVKQDKGSLWGFVPSLLKQRRLVINIVLAAVLITIISICGSYFLQAVIDTYIPNNMHSTLAMVALGLIIFYTFQAIFTYAQNFLLAVLGQRLSIEIILGYIRHVFELPMSFFATRRTGEIVSRFTDASKIIDALASTIVSLFLDVSIVVIMGVILVIQNMTLFWITLLSLPVYAIVILAFNKSFERLNQKEMESNAILSSAIIEDLHGIETVKALNGETERYQKIDSEFVDYLRKSLAYLKADTLQQSLKLFIQLVLEVVVLWVGANLVIHNQLSVGELMTYNALLAYFVNPLQNIINLQTKLQSAKVANNRLNEVYLVASEFEESRPIHNESQLNGDIKIQNVSYRYGYGENVLDDINLTIQQQDKVAIVGMSGSGKSTLVKLLIDFYQPNNGDVMLNGFNVKNIDKHTLRTHINYIPQEPYIFSGTIEENIRLGNRDGVTQDDITNACQLALIDTDINKMSMQYQTKLDENGNTLSGGQRQRLTIARALLSPAQVLIFDESTSGLDAITEKRLIDNLVAMTDKTIIFIAHRLSIAKRTNHIIVLHDGQVVEEGTHAALLGEHGYYYDLINS